MNRLNNWSPFRDEPWNWSTSLVERRGRLTEQFLTNLLNPTSCLHDLILAKSNSDVICNLRCVNNIPCRGLELNVTKNQLYLTTVNNNCNHFKTFETFLCVYGFCANDYVDVCTRAFVCVDVSVCVCVHVKIYVLGMCAHVCVFVCMYVYMHYVYIYIYIYMRVCVCVCVFLFVDN